ncbi:Starch-binding associating with outer membrane [Mucilaginibacter pineti]|uniref:Starch-binding associating with outer membrane n=1 Tax=Mucilaginibacter pineti TaxID=1391627 RepID=A0A1G6U4K1_9SPHI|nr:RagB/SusD family nutrient uptake outer membrane protein [Mucilaginibacter pineti]SDD36239.1 Starch-binding associating with outer membrane [Mucilaginibacter pineti]
MKLTKINIYSWLIIMIIMISGCKKDFLNRPPLTGITTDNFYKSKSDLRLATAALYAQPWFYWNQFPMLGIGDIMSGNMLQPYNGDLVQFTTFSITPQNSYIEQSWKSFFDIVAHCNINIKTINTKVPDSVAVADKNGALGELRFIRASSYFLIAQIWGAVPIIEDNDKLIANPLVPRNKLTDVYKFIINDLRFAATNLPNTDQPGRVTTWSAQGLLAKVYLTRAGLGQSGSRNQADLDSAAYYAGKVCNTSGLALLPSYYNLFKTQFNDNPESLFAFQWAPGVGYGNGNAIEAQFAPSASIVTGGGGYGGAIGPTIDLANLYSEQDSIRRKATFMLTGEHYPELNAAGGGYTATGVNVKKHIVGTAADNNSPTMDFWSSIEHNTVLRLGDVYLVYVEALLGNNASTTNAEAVKYFNAIRSRAGVDPINTITPEILRKERRVELAFEGQYWFDLVRLSYYDPQAASDALNKQQRQQFTYNPGTGVKTPVVNGLIITPATVATFTLPIPANDQTADPRLLEEPVEYYK